MASIEVISNKNGTTSYRVKVRRKGYKPISKTFKRKSDAQKFIRKIESDIDAGRQVISTESSKHTLAEAIDRYIQNILPRKPKSFKKQSAQLEWWKDHLGGLTLNNITSARVTEAREQLANGLTPNGSKRSPATVNRYLAILSHLFSIAVKEWEWCNHNPVSKISKLRESRGRVRFLDKDELQRLLSACKSSYNPQLYPIVFLALSTGARKNEILSLTRDDIDLNRRIITFKETKNNSIRSVPITNDALKILRNLVQVPRLDTKLLFPSKIYPQQPIDIRKAWVRAINEAGIEDFVFHDLRHTCASYLSMSGCSSVEIASILGHKTLEMVKRYSHLSVDHVASVVERMNKKMFK